MNNDKISIVADTKSWKDKKWIWVLVVLVLVLLGMLGFWQQQKVTDLNNQVKNLTTQGNELKTQIETLAKENETLTKATRQTATAKYSAEVGKFTLTLSSDYAIVVRHDGAGEGSPTTQLLIADKILSPGVVESDIYYEASVNAISLFSGSFNDAVQSRIKDRSPTKLDPIVVDGVGATVYRVEGLSASKMVFFTKNGIFYQVELNFTGERTDKLLDAIVNGFKFN